MNPLTRKEKKVLEFIESYIRDEGVAPSFQEIKEHFDFASFNSVQRYLKQLQRKNYVHIPGNNQKRAITVLHSANALQQQTLQRAIHPPAFPPHSSAAKSSASFYGRQDFAAEALRLPLLGRVAAGAPIEASEHDEFFDVPTSLVRDPDHSFALKVEGQSMIKDGIFDGDVVLVRQQKGANNGDIVVATVDNESTVKRFFLKDNYVELRPSNSEMTSMWYSPEQVQLQGIVVGLIRKF